MVHMIASLRKEVLTLLTAQAQKHEIIPISRSGRTEAFGELRVARDGYEDARKKALFYELAMFYRVAIFGSARLNEGSEEFKFVTNLTKALVEARDVDIVTGGGPGIMEAANYGTRLAIQEANGQGVNLRGRNFWMSHMLHMLPTEVSGHFLNYCFWFSPDRSTT